MPPYDPSLGAAGDFTEMAMKAAQREELMQSVMARFKGQGQRTPQLQSAYMPMQASLDAGGLPMDGPAAAPAGNFQGGQAVDYGKAVDPDAASQAAFAAPMSPEGVPQLGFDPAGIGQRRQLLQQNMMAAPDEIYGLLRQSGLTEQQIWEIRSGQRDLSPETMERVASLNEEIYRPRATGTETADYLRNKSMGEARRQYGERAYPGMESTFPGAPESIAQSYQEYGNDDAMIKGMAATGRGGSSGAGGSVKETEDVYFNSFDEELMKLQSNPANSVLPDRAAREKEMATMKDLRRYYLALEKAKGRATALVEFGKTVAQDAKWQQLADDPRYQGILTAPETLPPRYGSGGAAAQPGTPGTSRPLPGAGMGPSVDLAGGDAMGMPEQGLPELPATVAPAEAEELWKHAKRLPKELKPLVDRLTALRAQGVPLAELLNDPESLPFVEAARTAKAASRVGKK